MASLYLTDEQIWKLRIEDICKLQDLMYERNDSKPLRVLDDLDYQLTTKLKDLEESGHCQRMVSSGGQRNVKFVFVDRTVVKPFNSYVSWDDLQFILSYEIATYH